MKRYILFILAIFIVKSNASVILTGKVICSEFNKPLHGANVYIHHTTRGTVSKPDGSFIIKSSQKQGELVITYMGYDKISHTFNCFTDTLDLGVLRMESKTLTSETIQVSAQREQNTASTFQIAAPNIREMATALPDPLLALKTLPGVSSANDQSSLYNVRGGNIDENLIRINGFEIYQPYLVRKGYLENPSLVNPYMIHSINMITGAFPVDYEDKLSSALDINYKAANEGWTTSADLRTIGLMGTVAFKQREKFNFILGSRMIDYGYLMSGNQLQGEYDPYYRDIQAALTYKPFSRTAIELISLLNNSQYSIVPEEWAFHTSHMGSFVIQYDDSNINYNYDQSMYGARLTQKINKNLSAHLEYSQFNQQETDKSAIKEILLYFTAPESQTTTRDSIFSYSDIDNHFKAQYKTLKGRLQFTSAKFNAAFGFQQKHFALKNSIRDWNRIGDYDNTYYRPAETFTTSADYEEQLLSYFAEISYCPTHRLFLQGGVRYTKNTLNNEAVLQPRLQMEYILNEHSKLFLAAGRYAQPPISRELLSAVDHTTLKSQKCNLYSIGGRFHYKRLELKCEAFYKDQFDLISYELEDVKLSYSGLNDSRGIVYGLDTYLRFDQSESLTHWLSVSWLNARENIANDERGFMPMPTDRRLQVSIYSEDRMDGWENSKVHLRVLFGTGYPYTGYTYIDLPNTNKIEKELAPRNSNRIPCYMRFDVGYTQTFTFFKKYKVVLREELLNMFEHRNTLAIETTPWNDEIKYVMSQRIYNLGVMVEF